MAEPQQGWPAVRQLVIRSLQVMDRQRYKAEDLLKNGECLRASTHTALAAYTLGQIACLCDNWDEATERECLEIIKGGMDSLTKLLVDIHTDCLPEASRHG